MIDCGLGVWGSCLFVCLGGDERGDGGFLSACVCVCVCVCVCMSVLYCIVHILL